MTRALTDADRVARLERAVAWLCEIWGDTLVTLGQHRDRLEEIERSLGELRRRAPR